MTRRASSTTDVLGLEPSSVWQRPGQEAVGAEFETGTVTLALINCPGLGIPFRPTPAPLALQVDDVAAARAELEARASSSTTRSTAASATWPISATRTATRSCCTTATRRVSRTVSGFGPVSARRGRAPRSGPSPPRESSKSQMSMFSSQALGLIDFGKTTLPSWMCQRSTTWPGVRPCAAAISSTTGSSIALPLASGLQASVTMPRSACSRRRPACAGTGAARSG